MPASNTKLFTTAAALKYLGPDFRSQTHILTNGVINENTLYGDIVILGTGDPSLGNTSPLHPCLFLDEIVDAIFDKGIKIINCEFK